MIVELKRRNPRFGCPRIAQQINKAFGIGIDKDVVRRVLAAHYHPACNDGGPSWLTFLGHMKDSIWSIDLFRCESILLKSHWVLVIMDQFTRRIIGFGAHAGDVDGVAFVACSTRLSLPSVFRTTSVLTMTRRSGITDGKPTCGFWVLKRLRPSRTPRYHIPSLSGSLVRFVVNILTTSSSGMFRTLNENSGTSGDTTIVTGSINR